MVEEGTGMENDTLDRKPIVIQFKASLTYAERLMLKRARRTELGSASPSQGW